MFNSSLQLYKVYDMSYFIWIFTYSLGFNYNISLGNKDFTNNITFRFLLIMGYSINTWYLVIFINSITYSQECTAGDCIEGYGNYIYKDGLKYMDMFEESKKSGEGMYVYPDG